MNTGFDIFECNCFNPISVNNVTCKGKENFSIIQNAISHAKLKKGLSFERTKKIILTITAYKAKCFKR